MVVATSHGPRDCGFESHRRSKLWRSAIGSALGKTTTGFSQVSQHAVLD